MAQPKGTTKTLLTSELTLKKSTPGTHILANEDMGLSFYIPKPFFAASGCKPESKFKITIEEVQS